MVSQKHANFLINTGSASAADIEGLGEEVRRRVYETTGTLLEWEIHRVGLPARDLETTAAQSFFSCPRPEAWVGGSDDYRPITSKAP